MGESQGEEKIGLDTYLTIRKKLTPKEKICVGLGYEEITQEDLRKPKIECYWGKNFKLVEIFGEVMGIIIENLTSYFITKEQLERIAEITNDIQIKEALEKINWEEDEVIFHNWW